MFFLALVWCYHVHPNLHGVVSHFFFFWNATIHVYFHLCGLEQHYSHPHFECILSKHMHMYYASFQRLVVLISLKNKSLFGQISMMFNKGQLLMLSHPSKQIVAPYLWIEFLSYWLQVLTNLLWISSTILSKLHGTMMVYKTFWMGCWCHRRKSLTSCQDFVWWLNSFLFIRSFAERCEGEGLAYE